LDSRAHTATIVVADNIPGDHGGTANRKKPQVLRGLNKSTGDTSWESTTAWKYNQWTASSSFLFVADRKPHALVGTGNETSPDSFLTVVDIRAANELWRSEIVELSTFTSPAVADGMIVFGSVPYGAKSRAAGLYAYSATAPK